MTEEKTRCKWCNMKNPQYVKYHDEEWGQQTKDEQYLYEMFILETFQAGLSWEIILNKRKAFKDAYDNFNIDKIIKYDETKKQQLYENKDIIRNKLKINASVENSKIYKQIVDEYGSFYNYLKNFIQDEIIYEYDKTQNEISDRLSDDLKKRGMKFTGSITIYSYLQAIGVINSHTPDCFMYKK
ncbi:MAG: DNA-3-methyladenine glycosylase I [Methanosphaera sp.]|uniref:DNA-3-methyladenine glycosylase I n=1 Tax=Methanosphaera sp. TaxID=2666342 RepID=UPI0025D5EBB5|nr:DNA-3-methyladenine glycosylase I [Methanosphaera sp.]MCI5867713.1 DNA-3-methyladenine glycosylase I [Methanosphaera sp.]MDD6535327.1 DNA-3-methyladenine glycosylase I [Methanosphaera sp.]MDY3956489.1 DNA-3-methyladenine glycosylase I [Methanosphaera sp.]